MERSRTSDGSLFGRLVDAGGFWELVVVLVEVLDDEVEVLLLDVRAVVDERVLLVRLEVLEVDDDLELLLDDPEEWNTLLE
jgi:hypothetical protein